MATKKKARALDLGDAAKQIEIKMRELAQAAYTANRAKNAASKAEEKARGELLALMKHHKLQNKIFEGVTVEGALVNLEADIKRSERETADVLALAQKVDKDTFMQIVKAGKQDVIDLAGLAVFEQVKKVSIGEENVTVKPVKG